jgi:signal transduction histidine kinase
VNETHEEPRDRLCETELAFFGRLGADVSHELRNILSIIGENAGLLDDLLSLAERGKPLDGARLKKLSASIAGQVRRGTETMERFSRFAHAADQPTASFDLTAATENLVALLQRQVAAAGCRLEADLPRDAIPLRTNFFGLQYAVFSAVELVLGSLEPGGWLRIQLAAQGRNAMLVFSGGAASGGGEPAGPLPQRLSAVIDGLQGDLRISRADGTLSLTLTLPIQ